MKILNETKSNVSKSESPRTTVYTNKIFDIQNVETKKKELFGVLGNLSRITSSLNPMQKTNRNTHDLKQVYWSLNIAIIQALK